ncbi:MAG: cysteine-rich small domain-containing protein [Oscillospiraceae bacterium]|nr:cysteine-rich small domain-containing protein [Oscillospiraceae bacterium]
MKKSHKFFENRDCKYFPCHECKKNASFNCIFCFCPLYSLGDKCGGNFAYDSESGVKSCAGCNLPHTPKYYAMIISKLKEAGEKK